MKRVFKYNVATSELPIGFKVLHGGIQNGEYFFWAEIEDTELETVLFDCQVYGTGQVIESDAYTYLNTIFNSNFIWHFYWRTF